MTIKKTHGQSKRIARRITYYFRRARRSCAARYVASYVADVTWCVACRLRHFIVIDGRSFVCLRLMTWSSSGRRWRRRCETLNLAVWKRGWAASSNAAIDRRAARMCVCVCALYTCLGDAKLDYNAIPLSGRVVLRLKAVINSAACSLIATHPSIHVAQATRALRYASRKKSWVRVLPAAYIAP